MTPTAMLLIFVALSAFVAGQLLLKRAMEYLNPRRWFEPRFLVWFVGGVAVMTISFFLSLGLLQRFDLSYYYPFHGLTVIIVSLASAVLLKEKLTLRLTLGAIVISAGVVLVSLS